jgi:leucyl-tRNA synthetase
MHRSLVTRYIELQALVLTPIAPHWADYIWQEVLGNTSTIQNALWPTVPAPNPSLTAAREYVRATSSAITSAEAAQQKRKDKGKNISFDPKKPKQLTIFMAAAFPAWQNTYISIVRDSFDAMTLHIDEKNLNTKVQAKGKAEMKKAMPFVQSLKKRLQSGEKADAVFDRELTFDESEILVKMVKGLRRTTGCKVVEVVRIEGDEEKTGVVVVGEREGEKRKELPPVANQAKPGSPSFHFVNIEG